MHSLAISPHPLAGVYTDGVDLYTRSLVPGAAGGPGAVGAPVRGSNGHEYRPFPPGRTKLAALVKRGVRAWPFAEASRVLYLGAGAGTTVSFVSDICPRGTIISVEFAPDPFRELVEVARARPNVVPVLADARAPTAYRAHVGGQVDVVYQDVAQRDQWDILRRNADAFLSPGGRAVLMVKARSVDVSVPAREVYGAVRREVEGSPYEVMDFVELDPCAKGHGAFVLGRRAAT